MRPPSFFRIYTKIVLLLVVCCGVWLSYPANADPPLLRQGSSGTSEATDPTRPGIAASFYQPITPSPAQTSPPTAQLIRRVESVNNMVALTFDDGPYEQKTAEYLAVLKEHNVRATFFLVGQRMQYYPELAQEILLSGNDLGSHSWAHGRLDRMSADALRNDFQLVNNQAQETLGATFTTLRPPYGGTNNTVLDIAAQMGYHTVSWDVDPQDWLGYPPDYIVDNILNNAQPGSIILLHEGRENTLNALPAIITGLRARGLEPVSVSVLLSRANMAETQ